MCTNFTIQRKVQYVYFSCLLRNLTISRLVRRNCSSMDRRGFCFKMCLASGAVSHWRTRPAFTKFCVWTIRPTGPFSYITSTNECSCCLRVLTECVILHFYCGANGTVMMEVMKKQKILAKRITLHLQYLWYK